MGVWVPGDDQKKKTEREYVEENSITIREPAVQEGSVRKCRDDPQ